VGRATLGAIGVALTTDLEDFPAGFLFQRPDVFRGRIFRMVIAIAVTIFTMDLVDGLVGGAGQEFPESIMAFQAGVVAYPGQGGGSAQHKQRRNNKYG
jgi:hypothetical protein